MVISNKLAYGSLILLGSLSLLAGCDRQQDTGKDMLNLPDLKGKNPDAEAPSVEFPVEWQQADATVNEFIRDVLDICHRGDYDKLCQSMATSDTPPSQEHFKRLWQGVGKIAVRSVRGDGKPDPTYYIHATVDLRQPDSEKRTQRELVVQVSKELGQWRLAAAPKEITGKVLRADSQPAPEPAEKTEEAEENRSAETSASTDNSVAPK